MTADKILGRNEILSADDRKQERVPVPEWGGTVIVQSLTGAERDAYEQTIIELRKDGETEMHLENARAKLLVRTLVDESGKLLFNEEDVVALGEKNAAAMNRAYDKAMELSGLRKEDVKELVGNSKSDQSEGSTSS